MIENKEPETVLEIQQNMELHKLSKELEQNKTLAVILFSVLITGAFYIFIGNKQQIEEHRVVGKICELNTNNTEIAKICEHEKNHFELFFR